MTSLFTLATMTIAVFCVTTIDGIDAPSAGDHGGGCGDKIKQLEDALAVAERAMLSSPQCGQCIHHHPKACEPCRQCQVKAFEHDGGNNIEAGNTCHKQCVACFNTPCAKICDPKLEEEQHQAAKAGVAVADAGPGSPTDAAHEALLVATEESEGRSRLLRGGMEEKRRQQSVSSTTVRHRAGETSGSGAGYSLGSALMTSGE